jgi:hypothetical protein
MDFDLHDSDGTSLWYAIRSLPGVYRCDPCARTPDLGKWNISSCLQYNNAIKTWLADNLPKYFAAAPNTLPQHNVFPAPEILSKDRRGSALSVNSGMTDASPLDDYMRSLESNYQPSNQPAMVVRNPWISSTPVEEINYSFNLDDFPTPPKTAPATVTTTPTVAETTLVSAPGPPTAVSAITEDIVSTAVKTQLSGLEAIRLEQATDFPTAYASLKIPLLT